MALGHLGHLSFSLLSWGCLDSVVEPYLSEPLLNLWTTHEQLPEQAGAVVLNHWGYRALIDSQVTMGVPIGCL